MKSTTKALKINKISTKSDKATKKTDKAIKVKDVKKENTKDTKKNDEEIENKNVEDKNEINIENEDLIVNEFKQFILDNIIDANKINKIKPVISQDYLKIISEKY